MNLHHFRISEDSYFKVSEIEMVSPLEANREIQRDPLLFHKLTSLLRDKPGFTEEVVCKLLELPHLNSQSDVLLVANSFNLRWPSSTLSEVLNLVNDQR